MAHHDALDSEYENGVADVLGFLAGDTATVERNVKLPGRLSKTKRQVDVLVRRQVFGAESLTVVDCKRWSKPLDVADVGSFLSLVEDVGADQGLLVSTKGASSAAAEFAHQSRGVRLDVMSLQELQRWSPPGTVSTEYRIPLDKQAAVSRALRRAGFRVAPSTTCPPTDAAVTIHVFRHYGQQSPSGDLQTQQWEQACAAMAKAGVLEPIHVSHGVTVQGGTPAHQWLEIDVHGEPVGLKICAATEAEAEFMLDAARQLASANDLPGHELSYLRPPEWPAHALFGGWPQA